ncbi:MAG: TIGR02453 family protein [Myxococcota bacterium]
MPTQSSRFSDETFEFLSGLRDHNEREWFSAHRDVWVASVRDPFGAFLEAVSEQLANGPLPLRGGPKTMFRIQRDVRFSKDKRPYSTSASGLLTRDGTKAEDGPLAYVELGPEGGRVGGGLHRPRASDLSPVRKRLVDEPEAFDAVLTALSSVDASLSTERQVKTMPRGFAAHAAHRHAQVIRGKELLAMRPISVDAWLSGAAVRQVVDAIEQGLKPLYDFIGGAR